jgi:hypothetical protein
MLRIALIGVGVVTTALTGWLVKRRFFSATDGTPPVIIQMPQVFRHGSRRKKEQRNELSPTLENGDNAAEAGA